MSVWPKPSPKAIIEAAAWSTAALLEWSTHWSAAAASTVAGGIAAYLRRQRPVAAAAALATGFLLQTQLGVSVADSESPYVPVVLAIVLAYFLGSRLPTAPATGGLAVLLAAFCGLYLLVDGGVASRCPAAGPQPWCSLGRRARGVRAAPNREAAGGQNGGAGGCSAAGFPAVRTGRAPPHRSRTT
jgi:hypothetical protein